MPIDQILVFSDTVLSLPFDEPAGSVWFDDATVVRRDLNDGIGFVDEAWIAANLTPDDERTPSQRERLAESDALIAELEAADLIVIDPSRFDRANTAQAASILGVDRASMAAITYFREDYANEALADLLNHGCPGLRRQFAAAARTGGVLMRTAKRTIVCVPGQFFSAGAAQALA